MAGVLATPVAAEVDDAPPPTEEESGRYVVIMDEEPLVTEFGQDAVDSSAAEARADELEDSHDDAASAAGVSANRIARDYTVSLNGFAVELTDSEAARMKHSDGVLMVLPDFMRYKQTDSSPDFLGLAGPGGAHNTGLRGEDVIVGIIDTGIWPEHPSFADDGTYSDLGIELDEDFRSACDFGNTAHNPDDAPFECNNKLIGARQMLDTYRAVIGADPDEFDSARDDDGHGSHTAGTAAGNANVEAEIFDQDLGKITGIAPRARVIAYKGLGNGGGFTSDLAAAIDQAVFDGVDVINYSIGGGAGAVGADEIAFLFAADAGVYVATSAGNSGSGPATLGDPGTKPWLTTVGASTQSRFYQGRARLANRSTVITGASITRDSEWAPLVDAEDAGGDLCIPGTLDPEVVDGNIVLCRRGAIARAAKSLAVYQAGGAGMIMYNNNNVDNLITDSHWVPSIHTDLTEGLAVKDYIDDVRFPRARIDSGQETTWDDAPTMAIFSSRGPNPVAPDIIKPDVTAPGVQILAANSPFPDPLSTPAGELFQAIQGTSMSSPHVAGLFALIKEKNPDWSAEAAKSAIMTTADTWVLDNDRVSQADPFDMGSGHIDPGRHNRKGSAFQPGLVYDAGFADYLGFLCDAFPEALANPEATCTLLEDLGVPTDASDLNYPSIGIGELAGSQTITRTVTSVTTGGFKTFRVSVDEPEGYSVEVYPKEIRLKPGQSATYQVTITNETGPFGEWMHGSLTWKHNQYEVRSPISVRGVSITAPATVTGSGVDGSDSFGVTFGYTGDYTAAGHGLEPATVFSDNVLQDPDQDFDPSDVDAGGANLHTITTSGTAALLIKLPPEATEANADLDVYVDDPLGQPFAASTAGGTNESILITNPMDGDWSVYVHGWSSPGGDSDYDLFTWVISETPGGNLSVDSAPASAVSGGSGTVDFSWTGATEGEWHMGAVSHSDGAGLLSLTFVDIDNRP